jgi:radical SAM enzyme (TIGR01210 family)
MTDPLLRFTDQQILDFRPPKNILDPNRPYGFLIEPECMVDGHVEDVATVFLTNRECPYRCLMCDLWRNTIDMALPIGAIPQQIDFALGQLSSAKHLKLYNSGNFFDRKAIPPEDYPDIASRARKFRSVTIENHPKFCGLESVRFRDLLNTELTVAVGLETVNEGVLRRLNKCMTLGDFEKAVSFLLRHGIGVRSFILLRPPFMGETEGIDWAIRSLSYAFSVGVECCSVIPTRSGNGALERLQASGDFEPPTLSSMEIVLEAGLRMRNGRVFMDLWNIEEFYKCTYCGSKRKDRMNRMNLSQKIVPPIQCSCDLE